MYKYYDKDLNVQEVELQFSKKFNLFYRPNTSDFDMIKEGTGDYPTLTFENKVVMDCGANIGSFTARAVQGGAREVIAYEPEEFNFSVLLKNLDQVDSNKIVLAHQVALIATNEPGISFYMGKSKKSACSGSTNPSTRKLKIDVVAFNFYTELDKIKPNLVKMDIEGGEYGILMDYTFPDYVKEIAVELHGFRKEQNEMMWVLAEQLKKQFPVIHFEKVCEVFQKPCLILGHFSRN